MPARLSSSTFWPTTDYFIRAIDAVKENKERYAAAEAQALLRPQSLTAAFGRSFVTSRIFKPDADEE